MLTPGTRIGAYEILSSLGAGGMGEVYRARDTILGRDVALKIIPEVFANDLERRARFAREAKTLASLNHPQIAQIYGFEQSGAISALVMELVDGEDLAQRIARGPIPVAEAMGIARQIAEALEAAHEQGIVHRDLKPSNIKVRPDRTVKVLDFGLAKAMARDDAQPDISQSPTVTVEGTRAGVILGTAAYMSPEQARGRVVDKRTDIWAFGCVLYEMLTGRAAFAADTVSDTIARTLERDPDWRLLPRDTPVRIHRVLKRCLEKDARRRLRDIGDARIELEEEEDSRAPIPSTDAKVTWRRGLVAVTVMLLLAVLAATVALWPRTPFAPRRPIVFAFSPPDNETFEASAPSAPAPSPDGRRIAFLTMATSGERVVWVRDLNSSTAHRVAGTEGAGGALFWSPDGRFIGFVADGRLKKIDPSGGPALNICPAMGNLGASWGRDNVIVFAPSNRSPLFRVAASGGTPEPMFALNTARGENSHRHPSFLPDGRHFLFTARSDVKENNLIYVGSLDSPDLQSVIAAQSNAVYSPPGYLLFAQDGTLMAQRFDARTLAVTGEAVPVVARVRHATPSSHAVFAVSLDGAVLTFQSQPTVGQRLAWFDRTGKHVEWVGADGEYSAEVRLAPNGKVAAVVLADTVSGNRDIWLLDLASGNLTRFTSHPANDWQVVWAPDSQEIAFASDRNGQSAVFRKRIEGGDERLMAQVADRPVFSRDWSADGRFLTLNVDPPTGAVEIWAVPLSGDGKPFPLNQAPAAEFDAMVSPDGEWVAYESAESGSFEVYVKPFARAGKRRISTAGGRSPRWRRDGRELFYRAQNGDLMVASLTNGPTLDVSTSRRLFAGCGNAPYDVNADGTRFLMICDAPNATSPPISVFVDWTAALTR